MSISFGRLANNLAKKWWYVFLAITLGFTQFLSLTSASAQVNTISITLAAAEPTTYNHETGGGSWGQGRENIDIRKSLEGENFACNDMVTYLTRVTAPNNSDLQANGAMTLDLNYSISMDTTGESGVALGEPVASIFNTGDSANSQVTSNSTATIINTSQTGEMFTKSAELLKTVRLTGVEAGETLIVRIDVKLHCKAGTAPSGNLQFRFKSGFMVFENGSTLVAPAEPLNAGEQTISLKNIQSLAMPSIVIAKTVTTVAGACPGSESILIEPNQQVKFCYAVTNDSNTGGKIGAPLYNVSNIFDDNGKYPDFQATLTSGLTDIDNDGQIDDLAIGATAYGSYITALDGDQDSVVTNIATVSGFSQPTGGTQYSASDTATVNIDAPAPLITINKLTNGTDGSTFLTGSEITWTYQVTNVGDRLLTNVYVVDDQGVTVSCPANSLAIGANMTCTATGTAIAGNYVNIGTVYGSWNGTQVSTTDSSSYFGANPKIDIQKTPDTQTVTEGLKATFTITVTNTGNVDLTGVVVTDALSSDCDKSIGALAVAAQSTYTCLSPIVTGNLTNVAVATGNYGTTQVTDDDSANVVVDYLPNIKVTKSVDPTSVLETGGSVTYTVSVENKAPENFVITSMTDDKFGDLNGQGTCVTPQTIAAGATYTCNFTKTLASDSLTPHVNVVTVTGRDPEDNQGSGSDDATVTFTDVKPNISATKTASSTSVLESGEDVTFTIVVSNNSIETVTVTSLVDDKFGNLNGQGNCLLPQTLVGNTSYTCAVTKKIGDWTLTPHSNTVTANSQDNEGNTASASASASVTIIDLLPKIAVIKSANPTIVRSTGETVVYNIKISNIGPETVTVTSLIDGAITLSGECLALIGVEIPVGGEIQCNTSVLMVIGAGNSFTNTATAIAKDNEDNLASASGSAVIKSYWFGRTPGFWKNHPQDWISGYLPTQFVQSIFTVPSSLMPSGTLDLDNNKSKDTLMAGLSYKGGSTTAGGAQILLRAAIAALLNEAYYGADYPAAASTTELISNVNATLATLDRSKYLMLANTLDKWNNGVEGPLP